RRRLELARAPPCRLPRAAPLARRRELGSALEARAAPAPPASPPPRAGGAGLPPPPRRRAGGEPVGAVRNPLPAHQHGAVLNRNAQSSWSTRAIEPGPHHLHRRQPALDLPAPRPTGPDLEVRA